MKDLRCLLGWHRYEYVGDKVRALRFGSESWDHECARCGDETHLGAPAKRETTA